MKRGLLVLALTSAGLLVACGGGGGGSSTTTTTTSSVPTSASSLTVYVDPSCNVQLQPRSSGNIPLVFAVPSTAASATDSTKACNFGQLDPTSSPPSYVLPIATCQPPNSTLTIVADTTATSSGTSSCGTLTDNYVPGGPTDIHLTSTSTTNVAQYAGTWTASYTGTDAGSCTVTVDSSGIVQLPTNCKSSTSGGTFTITGGLNSAGQFVGQASNGATYVGTFDATTLSVTNGTWTNGASSGTWTGSRTAP